MKGTTENKANEIRAALRDLGTRLSAGNDAELLVWVIPKRLACAHRPLRHHPRFGGSRRDLPPEASLEVRTWVSRVGAQGIRSIICLMHPKELGHYAQLDLGARDLIDLYRKCGFGVRHIAWDDPAHRSPSAKQPFKEELSRIREEGLQAFADLCKPVLLHCSAGIDRSAPVAAYIWEKCNC